MDSLAKNMFMAFENAMNDDFTTSLNNHIYDYKLSIDKARYGRFNERRYQQRRITPDNDCSNLSSTDALKIARKQTIINLTLENEIEPIKMKIKKALSIFSKLRKQKYFTESYTPPEGMYLNYFNFGYRHFIGFKQNEYIGSYVLADGLHFFVYDHAENMDFTKSPDVNDIRKFASQFRWFYEDLIQFMNFAIEENIRLAEEERLKAEAKYEKEIAEFRLKYSNLIYKWRK